MRSRPGRFPGPLLLLLLAAGTPALAQDGVPVDRAELPARGRASLDGPYPVRILTLETARLHARGDGVVGLGESRLGLVDRRLEIVTNTLHDILGVANVGLKAGVLDPEAWAPGVAVGGEVYGAYGGLLDEGIREIAESFSDVTDASADLSGWNAWASATWLARDGATNVHLAFQHAHPRETRFSVEDSVAGGGGTVTFDDGRDWSLMWGVDHRLVGDALLLLAEAGYSWGLDRARFGLGVDAGGRRWRVAVGAIAPGIETDVATDPREWPLTPTLSVHARF